MKKTHFKNDWDGKQGYLWRNECHLIIKETNGKMIRLKKAKKIIKYKYQLIAKSLINDILDSVGQTTD